MRPAFVLLFCMMLFSAVAQAVFADDSLIPREILFGDPIKWSVTLSPDGKMLGYQTADKAKISQIWVKTIGKDDDWQVTHARKGEVDGPTWQFDNEHVLYGQDMNGDENFHVYQTDIKTKMTRDMTPFLGVKASIMGMEPKFPDTLLATMNVRNQKLFDVYRINLKNGAVELDTENPGDIEEWAFDHNLKVRAAKGKTKAAVDELRVRDTTSSPWRTIMSTGPNETGLQIIGFTPDNQSLWVTTSIGANASRLIQIDVASGQSRDAIASDPNFDVGATLRDPKTHQLEAVCFTKERSEWQPLDKSVEGDLNEIKKISAGDFGITSQDLNNRKWLLSIDSDDVPFSYYLYDRDTKKSTFLFCTRPALEKYRLAKMTPISFTARDGMQVYGYLTLPPGAEQKNLPLVVDVHGGPWGRNVWGYSGVAQWLANRGYAVLQINFRGSTGYGKKYLNAGDREWAGKMHTDLLDGKDWAIKQGFTDPKRVAITGHSYGGYAALVGASFTPDQFTCAVASAGPSNILTLLASIPPYWETGKAMFFKRIGDPVKDKEFLESRSPLFKAQDITIPLLIVQGANDVRVKQAEGDQIVAAMRKNGKPVEYMIFPNEGHGFARPEDYMKFRAREEAFLAKYLGGRLEPIHPDEASDDLLH